MATSSKSATNQHTRSVCLPSLSHPSTLRIQKELNNLKNSPSTNLSELENLYKCTQELLNLSSSQQVLSQHQNEKWVDELLDGSIKILDICGNTMDLVSQMKEHLGDIQLCLRRRKGDESIERSLAKFTSFRKKMNKDAKKLITSLKKMDSQIGCFDALNNPNHHVLSVIRVLREVGATSISIFQSLLMFLSVPLSKANQKKWLLVSSLMRKTRVECESQVEKSSELENVCDALSTLCKYGASKVEIIQIPQNKIEALESRVEDMSCSLESIFRHLIRTRVSLLNIFSS